METYIALFRGINVGGKNIVPMKALTEMLNNLGFQSVKTYIQSGNVVFSSPVKDSDELADQIREAMGREFGFTPGVLIIQLDELEAAIKANPFPECEADPKTLHLGFLSGIPEKPNIEGLEAIKKESERFHLSGKVFYLHAPEGIGRSKLASGSERLIGTSMTLRNWRTVTMIRALIDEK